MRSSNCKDCRTGITITYSSALFTHCLLFCFQLKYNRGDFIRHLLGHLPYVAAFTLTWVILNEKIDWPRFLAGFAIAIIVLAFTNSQLLMGNYRYLYKIRFIKLVRYFLLLIPQIYKSGLAAIVRIIKGQDAVCLVKYPSTLTDDLPLALLANAVTLTPGTVTLDIDGQTLHILSFNTAPGSKSGGSPSISRIEKILKEKR